ncbi:MAG: ABC transporter permease [Anaerolineae bacterium]|nr:ABC transporter permease [Anaerolineae bacterium]
MLKYIIKRVLVSIPLLFAITVVVFALSHLMPGDAVLAMTTDQAPISEELIAIRRGQLGLDQPLPVQYVNWMQQVLQGNFGYSYVESTPVNEMIAARVLPTLQLMGTSLIFSIVVGVLLGLVSALRQYSVLDYALTILGFIGVSVPVFFLGMILVYVFALRLQWFPTSGMRTAGEPYSLVDNLRHLFLPALALAILRTAVFMRFTRDSVLEVLNQDYVRTARAKGLRLWTINWRHIFRNAMIPIVTVIGLNLPVLFAGAVFIETIFQWPGIGLLFIGAVNDRDAPVIMGLTLIFAIIVLGSNLLTDIAYALVDPRIAYD